MTEKIDLDTDLSAHSVETSDVVRIIVKHAGNVTSRLTLKGGILPRVGDRMHFSIADFGLRPSTVGVVRAVTHTISGDILPANFERAATGPKQEITLWLDEVDA